MDCIKTIIFNKTCVIRDYFTRNESDIKFGIYYTI